MKLNPKLLSFVRVSILVIDSFRIRESFACAKAPRRLYAYPGGGGFLDGMRCGVLLRISLILPI